MCLVAGLFVSSAAVLIGESRRSGAVEQRTVETRVLQDDSWIANVRSGAYFRKHSPGSSVYQRKPKRSPAAIDLSARSSLGRLSPSARDRRSSRGLQQSPARSRSTYRTVCVRLCDGYYFPISPSTTRGRFGRDARKCASSCGAPTRLYYQPAAGDATQLKDRSGRKYTDLKTAFLYRTTYQKNCQCRANPWEQEAKDHHKIYALQAERKRRWKDRKRRREIAGELKALRKTIRAARKKLRKGTKTATKSAMASISKEDAKDRVAQYVTKQTTRENAFTVEQERRASLARAIEGYALPDDGRESKASVTRSPNARRIERLKLQSERKRKSKPRRTDKPASKSKRRKSRRARKNARRRTVQLRKSTRPTKRRPTRYRAARSSNWRSRAFSSD
ncbi:MAG: DUF2865 domain-containing protein [Pseudomonadota bacterium]